MKSETKVQNNLLFFVLAFVALEAILFFTGNFKLTQEDLVEKSRIEKIKTSLDTAPILAKAVSVYNITENKPVYSKNDEVVMPLASLAKIMSVTVALNSRPKDDIVPIPLEAINQAGDFGLFANEKWKVSDLAKLTLISSANDGMYALSSGGDFLEKINSKIRKIGVGDASFINFTGLDLDPTTASVFASARDVNMMAMYAERAYPEIFSVTVLPEINLTSLSGFTHNFKNTNTIINKIPNLLFSKTGFTDVAGGNLTIIFRDKRGDEIVVTILGSTYEGRFVDMEKIVDVLYNS